jgi:hypothetical protein
MPRIMFGRYRTAALGGRKPVKVADTAANYAGLGS